MSDELEIDLQLAREVIGGGFDAVKAALRAGANLNGRPHLPYAPIVAATIADHAFIVKFFLDLGADPNRPVVGEVYTMSDGIDATVVGERALHLAARGGLVEIVRLLLKRSSRAGVNATDSRGYTPLMATCESSQVCVKVVRLLLEAGADPARAEVRDGVVPRVGGRTDRGKEVALRRMLKRGPAYRARAWAWPSDAEGAKRGGGDTAAAAAAATVFSSPPAVKNPPAISGVRIFRPREKNISGSKFFVRLVDR
ncbi:unnamed protein product [Laminaria digitata]